MTTTFENPVIAARVPAAGIPTKGAPALGVSGEPGVDELVTLRGRLEQQSTRRDNWTVMMFGVALVALLFSLMAVGFGVRAMSDARDNARVASASAVPAAPAAVPLNSVVLSDMKVAPSATTVAPGMYTVNIINSGMMEHELLVFHTDIAAADLPIGPDGKVAEDAPGFKISDGDNIAPGASQSRVIDLTQRGTYLFVCNLPGHFAAGMHTTVIVK